MLNEMGSCYRVLKRELIRFSLLLNHSTLAAVFRIDWMGQGGSRETNEELIAII